MKERLRHLGLLSLSIMAIGLVPDNAEAGTTYRIHCKGRFKTEAARSHMWIRFSKAPYGSSNGSSLANGQCAWADRALNSSQPTTIHFSYGMGKAVIRAIMECGRASGCVMGFFAEKEREPALAGPVAASRSRSGRSSCGSGEDTRTPRDLDVAAEGQDVKARAN